MTRADEPLSQVRQAAPIRESETRQFAYSRVSAFGGLTVAGTFVVDFTFMDHVGDVFWTLVVLAGISVAAAMVPIVMGVAYPRWAGLVFATILILGIAYFVAVAGGELPAINALMELPLFALYIGWFYRPVLSRSMLLGGFALIGFAVWWSGLHISSASTVLYAVLISLFCYETGVFLQRETSRRATTDPLTGALNRFGIVDRGNNELRRAARTGEALTVAVVDFDNFKRLNDTRGHAAGDAALRDTVAQWRGAVRSHDIIGRSGGDEFVFILPATELEQAESLLRRLREDAVHPWTWGCAQATAGEDLAQLMARADEQIYQRKRSD
ncbi:MULTISPECIES: sensor domain-containing diguanylate cyclase [unclassified Leucobacter]|uniref:GGDEF domain-containing protein n=1 Tax=unclassified Leucobacter TaxID=2621730 RepID=UPI00165E38F4|nr:sensor domain-containing diguanylate cyclase [Leucobacter sp. CX169]MBC9928056.1 diguanylate cyclase [Leucobacter sp. cx-169]